MKLQKWTKPQYYYGENWNEYYIFLSQNRDSQALERSNFECGLQKIGGKSETVITSHEQRDGNGSQNTGKICPNMLTD